jgi:hypothetical protein
MTKIDGEGRRDETTSGWRLGLGIMGGFGVVYYVVWS